MAADPDRTAADIENDRLTVVADVRAAIGVPLAVKLSPYFSSMANFARGVIAAGADGLVLFNRFYQPDIDLDTLDVVPRVELSSPWELRLPLRWTAILRPLLGGAVSLAATTGIASGTDAAKAIAVGADVAMMTSAILRHGPEHVRTVTAELQTWLDDHEYESVDQLRGSMSYRNVSRSGRLRARQLHEGPALLDIAGRAHAISVAVRDMVGLTPPNDNSTERKRLSVD